MNSDGVPIVDLDQIGLHNAIEHDVSMTRRDFAQGDSASKQKDLVEQLTSIGNGDKVTIDDFAELRKKRYEQQKRDNGQLDFGQKEYTSACSEVSLILAVYGDTQVVRRDYLKSIFAEERLPYEEGWEKPKGWWGIGILAMKKGADQLSKLIGFVPPKKTA